MSLDVSSLSVGRIERLIAIRGFPGYDRLPASDVARISARMTERRYRADDYLMHEGDPAAHIYFVIRGDVEIRKKGRVLRRLKDRSVVGGISALAEDPEGYDVVAMADTTTLRMSVEDAWDVFEDHFTLINGAITRIAAEIMTLRSHLPSGFGFQSTEWTYGDEPMPPPMDLVGRMAELRRAIPFAGSNVEALADLARDVSEVRFDEATDLWTPGEPSDYFLFVRHGIVRGEAEGQVMRFGPGDVVGSLGSLSRQPRWYEGRTEGPLVALKVDREAWTDLLEDHFHVARRMVTALSRGMLALMEQTAPAAAETDEEAA